MLKLATVTVIVKKCLNSKRRRAKKSKGQSICFSCTWKENKKKFMDTVKRDNRNCFWVGARNRYQSDGKHEDKVRIVAALI